MTTTFIQLLVLIIIVIVWFHVKSRRTFNKFPPGPHPLPIIGNILKLLGQSPHISLTKLSLKYGPLMYLKLGKIHTIVVSSPEIAKQVLQTHDHVFCSRTLSHASESLKSSIVFLPVGDEWKMLRNICKENMFSTRALDKSKGIRQEKIRDLHDYVQGCCDSGRSIHIGETAFTMMLSLMSATLFSYDLGGFGSDSAPRVRRLVREFAEALGAPNIADFFPILKGVDPQGIIRKFKISYTKILGIFKDIVEKRLESGSTGEDFLDVLIRLGQQNESEFSCSQIKFLLFELLVGAIDTTTSTVEWAMTELLRHPDKMSKVEDELGVVLGERNQVQESDIPRLPYLQAVIKETLRYHPSLPLSLPHKALADVKITGYTIPTGAQVLVNLWAIGRDSNIWPNPDSFKPERFLKAKIDYKGQDFEFIPFGSGRRMCVGWPLAHRMLPLVLASLIHGFHWKLEGGMKPSEIDVTERFGMSLEKAIPLKVIPVNKIIKKKPNTEST